MSVSYIRLWKLLLDRRMKKTDLKIIAGLSNNTVAKLSKDEYISMESLERICNGLNCSIEDVVEFIKE